MATLRVLVKHGKFHTGERNADGELIVYRAGETFEVKANKISLNFSDALEIVGRTEDEEVQTPTTVESGEGANKEKAVTKVPAKA